MRTYKFDYREDGSIHTKMLSNVQNDAQAHLQIKTFLSTNNRMLFSGTIRWEERCSGRTPDPPDLETISEEYQLTQALIESTYPDP
ncbi:MAG TPA: hypothetical protein VG934_01615 [Candidatus Paceibacterota bacterium]|nr:hypothetical protein [Candidatus Paceibacterota bacterium]